MAREGKRLDHEGWGLVKRCPACGAEESRCTCPPKAIVSLPFGKQRPRFRLEKRRGKPVTVITHLTLSEADLKALSSQLKNRLGTGGTAKDGEIELQGDHREALVPILAQLGFRT
jgi:translation initiation factor 1